MVIEMKTKILIPILMAAILIASAGAFSLNFGIHSYAAQNNSYFNGSATSNWGWNFQNMTYNTSMTYNAPNKSAILKQVGVVSQCRTNFIDTAAPIASSALNITLNTTAVNSANSRLQSNITSNASIQVIRSDVRSFNSAQAALYWQAAVGAHKLNQTQIVNLRAQLNSSVQTLKNCVSASGSSTSGSFNLPGFGAGFLHWFTRFHIHGFSFHGFGGFHFR